MKTNKTSQRKDKVDSSRRERWVGYRRILLRCLAVVALAAGTFLSLELKDRVEADSRFKLSEWTLELGDYPGWVDPHIRAQIEAIRENGIIGPKAGDGTIFRPNLLIDLQNRLLENSWIREVHDARLSYPGVGSNGSPISGGLNVSLELRRPVAVVTHGGRYYLTDAEGIRLGSEIPGPADRSNDDDALDAMADRIGLPVIAGSESFSGDEAPVPGEVWQTHEILEGIEVAKVLQARRINETYESNRILVIDIQNVGGRIEPTSSGIVIRTGGLRPMTLVWGRSPISREAAASSVDEVVEKLELVLAKPEKWYGDSLAVYLDVPGKLVRVTRS